MKVTTANASTIVLWNEDRSLSVSKDSTSDIMGNLKFKVEDSDILRFYSMVEYEILSIGVTPGVTPGKTPGVNETGVTPPGEVTTPPPTAPTPTPKKTEPGFEAVFAIAGLLAVAFLVLRQRK